MQSRAKLAAIVGAVVVAYVIAQQFVSVVGYLGGLPVGQVTGMLISTGGLIATYYLPFAVGVFASLWLVAPLAADLTLAGVVKRSLLAAGIGAALVVVIRTMMFSADSFAGIGSFMGNSFPALPVDRVVQEAGFALQGGVNIFLTLAPLVMLTVIFLWMRLAKHPSRHAVSADSVEV